MNKFMIKMLDNYKKNISPNCQPRCRFYPTCSVYAKECYERFNFFKASALTVWRLLRCNPLNKGGYNPAPLKKTKIQKLTNTIYYLPNEVNTDRPNLGYIKGEKESVIIDTGASKKHIKHFYKELKKAKLPLPKVTFITHHHWDHTWGLAYTNTYSYGLKETNEILKIHQGYNFEKKHFDENIADDKIPYFCKDHILLEYKHQLKKIQIKLLDEEIESGFKYDLGNETLTYLKAPSNHTIDTAIILLEKAKFLFISDMLCGKIVHNDFVDDLEIIAQQKAFLENIDFNYALNGHGEIMSKPEVIEKLDKKLNP